MQVLGKRIHMSEPKETSDKTGAGAGGRKPLTLQRTVESGHVQQKFSHGRSKSVVVEVKRKRPTGEDGAAPAAPAPVARPQGQAPRPPQKAAGAAASAPRAAGAMLRTLSEEERQARTRALAAAHVRGVEEEKQRVERDKQDAIDELARVAAEAEDARLAAEAHAAAELEHKRLAAEAAAAAEAYAVANPAAPIDPTVPAPAPAPSRPTYAPMIPSIVRSGSPAKPAVKPTNGKTTVTAAPEAPTPAADVAAPAPTATAAPATPSAAPVSTGYVPRTPPGGMTRPMIVSRGDRPSPKPAEAVKKAEVGGAVKRGGKAAIKPENDDDDGRSKMKMIGGKLVRATTPSQKPAEEARVRGKLTITNAFDERQRERSLASLKRKREREKLKALGIPEKREKIMREVIIPEAITIQELSNRMAERAVDLIKVLMKEGAMHKITDVIDADTAELLVAEFGHTAKRVSDDDILTDVFTQNKDTDDDQTPRAPVVTIMGHVDHGKTSLLDAIRSANVASGEAGGITQHIGAYQVKTPNGQAITFIDTPGHEAFTAMRARGAKVTDIVVLVVAADDGVMPQTVEAINHAKAAKVPIIVAINKIDKPDADPTRVRTDLLQHEIVVESMSGDVQDVPVSATKRMNLDKLLEAIGLQAELLELKANANRSAEGFVIEAKLERGRGPVGTLLVQRGTLKIGDIIVAGMAWGRVRALVDDKGVNLRDAGPSVPVEVLGFDSAPDAGDQFAVVESEAKAREITDLRVRKRRDTLGSAGTPRTLEQMMQSLKDAAGQKEFTLLIKGDVQGSVEAIIGSLKKLNTDEVMARIVHTGVGGITESDVALANASRAVLIGFNVRANVQAKAAADMQGIEIRYYNIIYDLVDDVKAAMSGLLPPTLREVFLGNATIKEVFNITKFGKVAGCQVTEGKVERGAKVRLIRDNVVIHDGALSILKRFKDDVKEVPAGQECGMSFANYQDIRAGDVIECFNIETIKRSL
jgi:translation initiation factor IF-2